MAILAICALLLAACATTPNKPPVAGSKEWYQQRISEIDAAKTKGEVTPEQYLTLKKEADATRSAHLNAMYRIDYPLHHGGERPHFGPR